MKNRHVIEILSSQKSEEDALKVLRQLRDSNWDPQLIKNLLKNTSNPVKKL